MKGPELAALLLFSLKAHRRIRVRGMEMTAEMQYNTSYIFNELDKVNSLRNRIAHHEPICFKQHTSELNTSYVVNEYQKIQNLFSWMGIDSRSMLYGLDHVLAVCNKINALK